MNKKQLSEIVRSYFQLILTGNLPSPSPLSSNFTLEFFGTSFHGLEGLDEWIQKPFNQGLLDEHYDLIHLKITYPSTQMVKCKSKVLWSGNRDGKRFASLLKINFWIDIVNQNIYKVEYKKSKLIDGSNPFF
jgi:hypothetical protein